MFVTGLVEGTHLYNLTVSDQQKASDSIVVQLTVTRGKNLGETSFWFTEYLRLLLLEVVALILGISGEEETESVEILMNKDIKEWTYRLRRKLQDRIEASLAGSIEVNCLVF